MDKIESKTIFSNFIWKFGERFTAQFITMIVTFVLARLLTPDEYGIIALVMIFITFANAFVTNGFGNALVQKKDADDLDFSSVFWINIFIGVILYIILFLVSPLIARFYDMPKLILVVRVLAIRIIFASINSVQQAYVARKMLFKYFFIATLFGTIISGVVGITLAYRGAGIWALVTQYLINTSVDTFVLWITIEWKPSMVCSLERAKELFSYGWKLLLSGMLDTASKQVRGLIIGKVYTSADLAYYEQGDRYPKLIVVNVNSSIQAVLFPAMSKNQTDKEKIRYMTRKSIQVSSFLMWPIMVALAVMSPSLIKLLLTEKWILSVPYIQTFCIIYATWPIHTANLQAINAIGRSDIFLKLEVIKKVINMALLLITLKHGPLVIAYGQVASSLIATIVNAYPNRELLDYRYIEQIKDILPNFILAVIMGACINLISLSKLPDGIIIILQIFCGIFIYLSMARLSKNSSYKYTKRVINLHKN